MLALGSHQSVKLLLNFLIPIRLSKRRHFIIGDRTLLHSMRAKQLCLGSGCGSVGRAVTSNSRGPRFESSHQQQFIYIEHVFTVNCRY